MRRYCETDAGPKGGPGGSEADAPKDDEDD
jgi:hypothetical protein